MEKSQSLNWQDLRSVNRAALIRLAPWPELLKLLVEIVHLEWFGLFLFYIQQTNISGGKLNFNIYFSC